MLKQCGRFANVRVEMRDGFGKVGAGMAKITELLDVAAGKDDVG